MPSNIRLRKEEKQLQLAFASFFWSALKPLAIFSFRPTNVRFRVCRSILSLSANITITNDFHIYSLTIRHDCDQLDQLQ